MKVVLCDDDSRVCEEYTQILQEILAKAKFAPATFEVYDSGVQLLANWQWSNRDILLLDIRMPERDGIEVANELRKRGYRGEIIFLTVSKEHAFEAFDVDAYHYLVKDEVNRDKVESVFLEAYKEVTERERRYITLSRGGDLRNIAIDSIYYFAMKNRIMTVYYDDEEFSFYSTMDKIEEILKGQGFTRVHRAYLVATEKSRKAENGKEIHIANGDIIPLGAKYAKDCNLH